MGDVQDFLALQELWHEVRLSQVLEYWKSARYLPRFMDDYKLKTEVVRGWAWQRGMASRSS